MELVVIIALGTVLVVGVVLLWRSTPPKPEQPEHPESTEDDRKSKDTIVDVTPGGFGGGS